MILRLALRTLRRSWWALFPLLLTLTLATGGLSVLFRLEARIERSLQLEQTQLLGADLVATATRPLPPEWLEEARSRGLRGSEKISLATVLVSGDRTALAGLEAVAGDFPLRGHFELWRGGKGERRTSPPEPGTIWLDRKLLLLLGFPKTVTLGQRELRVEAELRWSPAAEFSLSQLLPRAVVRLQDLRESGLLGPGSLAVYSQLFAGDPEPLARFRNWLQRVKDPQVRLIDRPEPLRRSYERSRHLLAILKLLLAVLAMGSGALAVRSYLRDQLTDTVAILKSLGLGRLKLSAFLLTLALLILALATLLSFPLLLLLERLLPQIPVAGSSPPWAGLWQAPLLLLLLLLGTGGPPIWRLVTLPPWRLLRQGAGTASPWPEITALLSTLLLLAFWLGTWRSAALLFGSLLLLLLLSRLLLAFALRGVWGAAGTITAARLRTHSLLATGEITALAVVLGALGASLLLRTHLVDQFREQLPERAPNHFAVNLFPEDLGPFRRRLEELGARLEPFFPTVRGRLLEVGGRPVGERVRPGTVGEVALRRDLVLTWSQKLPPHNRIVAGRWWSGEVGTPEVSVEKRFAEGLGLRLGETLTFAIEGEEIEARVTSIREVEWTALTPNFFVIFSPGALDRFAATYITSFYLPPGRSSKLVQIARRFPHVTLLEIAPFLEAVRTTLDRMAKALELFLLLALALGGMLLLSAIGHLIETRREELLVLKALGASRKSVGAVLLGEFLLLGLLAALLAIPLAEGIYGWIAWRWFHLPPAGHPELLLLLPLAAVVLPAVALIGLLRLYRLPAAALLR